jgi:hypothetical protein
MGTPLGFKAERLTASETTLLTKMQGCARPKKARALSGARTAGRPKGSPPPEEQPQRGDDDAHAQDNDEKGASWARGVCRPGAFASIAPFDNYKKPGALRSGARLRFGWGYCPEDWLRSPPSILLKVRWDRFTVRRTCRASSRISPAWRFAATSKVADRFHNRVVKLFGHLFQPGKTAWVS